MSCVPGAGPGRGRVEYINRKELAGGVLFRETGSRQSACAYGESDGTCLGIRGAAAADDAFDSVLKIAGPVHVQASGTGAHQRPTTRSGRGNSRIGREIQVPPDVCVTTTSDEPVCPTQRYADLDCAGRQIGQSDRPKSSARRAATAGAMVARQRVLNDAGLSWHERQGKQSND